MAAAVVVVAAITRVRRPGFAVLALPVARAVARPALPAARLVRWACKVLTTAALPAAEVAMLARLVHKGSAPCRAQIAVAVLAAAAVAVHRKRAAMAVLVRAAAVR